MELKIAKNKPIEINKEEDPFKNDTLGRKQSIVNLTTLLNSMNEPFVISINGSWGSGKTTFIQLWKAFLERQGYKSLYFNAWENDFSKDPFISIVSEIKEQIIGFNKQIDGVIKASAEVFYDKSMALAIKSLPVIIKLLSNGLLNIDMLKGIVGESKNDLSEAFSKISENLINEKNLKKEFRESLQELAKKAGNGKKIVFFIDELDRCRPSYSVELLENIKHFFNVEGFVFVLAIDKQQLGYSLQTQYGVNMDTEGYLRRFIDLNFNLPLTKKDEFIYHLPQYISIVRFVQTKQEMMWPFYDNFKNNLLSFSNIFSFSLRDLEHLYSQASIAIRFYSIADIIQETLVPFLLVLKIKRFDLYMDFISSRISAKDLMQSLEEIKDFNDYMVDLTAKSKLEISLYIAGSTSAKTASLANAILNSTNTKYSNEIVNKLKEKFIDYTHNEQLKRIEEIIEFSGNF